MRSRSRTLQVMDRLRLLKCQAQNFLGMRSSQRNDSDSLPQLQRGRLPFAFNRKDSIMSQKHSAPKRRIYVNMELAPEDADQFGLPRTFFPKNKIRTSKYTLINFIPKNLFEQFRGVANLYFLFLAVLQLFPIFAGPNAFLAPLPLLAILAITAIKDAIEDWKRHVADNAVNYSKTRTLSNYVNVNVRPRTNWQRRVWGAVKRVPMALVERLFPKRTDRGNESKLPLSEDYVNVERDGQGDYNMETIRFSNAIRDDKRRPYRPGLFPHSVLKTRAPPTFDEHNPPPLLRNKPSWRETLWRDVQVGEFVYLENDEAVPADIVILATSESDGLCYVETKNLDGETNLKPRHSLRATSDIKTPSDCGRLSFHIESEGPHPNLYHYNGVIEWCVSDGTEDVSMGGVTHCKTEPITASHLLLRGSVLKNTQWVIGVVLFTGSDTKVMLNSSRTPSKRSRLEKLTNPQVVANFVILFALCLGCSIVNGFMFESSTSATYFEPGGDAQNGAMSGFLTFWLCLILYQNIVPISLYVSVEIVKTLAAYFIYSDLDMYYEPLDQPCVPKTWNISDDLGQIEYIFRY
ncbi:uncharacterized protein VTP21DRAFT_208 [Calcarisporiella thermophila]|uniref:uncharacterized protein n=1 Tax=Calcarisporiella thermophila TaxID=911321 RepID=UPI003743275D